MPKKVKLTISSLKVQSFVTSLDKGKEAMIKGGASNSNCAVCTDYSGCDTCAPTVCNENTCSCAVTCFTCRSCESISPEYC